MLAQQLLERAHTATAATAGTSGGAHLGEAAGSTVHRVGNVTVGEDLTMAYDHGGVLKFD